MEPLTNLISTTPAKSLQYECVRTVTLGMHEHVGIMRLAVEKLKEFVEEPDQNCCVHARLSLSAKRRDQSHACGPTVKYLGLLGMSNVMQHNPEMLSDMRQTVFSCLDDEDITIRRRALDLLTGMVCVCVCVLACVSHRRLAVV